MSSLSAAPYTGSERINLRLKNNAKTRIERAAAYAGKTVSAFILDAILPKAEETIEKHEIMQLSARDSEAFFAAIDNPPPFNAALTAALEEHDRRVINQ